MLEGDLPIFARGANEALLKELLQGLASYSENTINRQSTKKKIQLSVTKSTEARKDVGVTKRPHALKPEKYSLSDESVYGVRSLGTAQRLMLCDKLRKFQLRILAIN